MHELVAIQEFHSSGNRSEEHTSELQSQSNLVCRLLLEKKKQRSRGLRPGNLRTGLAAARRGPRPTGTDGAPPREAGRPSHSQKRLCLQCEPTAYDPRCT